MSAHMNPKRSWPGVPKRYSLSSGSRVMHPKSRATVVRVFSGTFSLMSTRAAAEVISAAVVSGLSSEMAPTAVVLPTPNPPAMTIFTGVGGRRPRTNLPDGCESTDHPFHEVQIQGRIRVRPFDDEITALR